MCDEKIVYRFAGSVVLISAVLAAVASPWWLVLTGFMGLNLLQAGFTGFCPVERILGGLKLFGCTPRLVRHPVVR